VPSSKWRDDYHIEATQDLELHHLYRAMAFIGGELEEQNIGYILGTRMRKVNEIKLQVLSRGGR